MIRQHPCVPDRSVQRQLSLVTPSPALFAGAGAGELRVAGVDSAAQIHGLDLRPTGQLMCRSMTHGLRTCLEVALDAEHEGLEVGARGGLDHDLGRSPATCNHHVLHRAEHSAVYPHPAEYDHVWILNCDVCALADMNTAV